MSCADALFGGAVFFALFAQSGEQSGEEIPDLPKPGAGHLVHGASLDPSFGLHSGLEAKGIGSDYLRKRVDALHPNVHAMA